MKKIIWVSVLSITTFTLISCSHLGNRAMKSIYLISIYKTNIKKTESFYNSTQNLVVSMHGRYLELPLVIKKDLPNPAQPFYTEEFFGHIVLIAEFLDKNHLNNYLNDSNVQELMQQMSANVKAEMVFSAKNFNPIGMMNSYPKIGSYAYRQDPAFLMINAIAMKSFLNPMNPFRVMSYMKKNTPKIKNAGVNILMPFEKVQDIRGHYPFDVMFLTEWPNEEVFNSFHGDQEFIDLTKKTRNKAFSAFTESKVSILTNP